MPQQEQWQHELPATRLQPDFLTIVVLGAKQVSSFQKLEVHLLT